MSSAAIYLGSDFTVELADAQDASTGTALTTATVTYALYTGAGVAVAGGTGSMPLASGTTSTYRGTIESTVTSTLTGGQSYYILITLVQGAYDLVKRLDLVAQAPGEVLIDADVWQGATGQTITGAALVALGQWCTAVRAALNRTLAPYRPEPVTLANVILDAPNTRDLILPVRPARSVASVYFRSDGNGLASRFTSDYLLDNTDGAEYQLLVDDHVNGFSRRGILRRVNQVWGVGWHASPGTLAPRMEPLRGSILVNYAAGEPTVPDDVRGAAVYMVTKLFTARKTGAPLSSESWNGYSASYAAGAVANLWKDDYVADLLRSYRPVHFG